MRCESAAMAKGQSPFSKSKPIIGSALRTTYDLFYSQKGLPIEISMTTRLKNQVSQLVDFYGLDIRSLRRGTRTRKGVWVLAGEWFGKTYVDYIAEIIADKKRIDR